MKTTGLYTRIWLLPRVGVCQSLGRGGSFKKQTSEKNNSFSVRMKTPSNRYMWKPWKLKKKTLQNYNRNSRLHGWRGFGSRPAFSVLRLSITHITRRTCYEILCFPRPTSKINKWLFQVMFLLSDINGKQLFVARAAGADAAAAHIGWGDKNTQRCWMNENGCKKKTECKNIYLQHIKPHSRNPHFLIKWVKM